jgi:hypothetical protein
MIISKFAASASYFVPYFNHCDPDSVVFIAYCQHGERFRVRIPVAVIFSRPFHTGAKAYPICTMGAGRTDHPTRRGRLWVELYLYRPSVLTWRVTGSLLFCSVFATVDYVARSVGFVSIPSCPGLFSFFVASCRV